MSVLALACAKEPVAVNGDGETSTVTFTVEVPETTVTTKGISDASTTDELICQVFLDDKNYTRVKQLDKTVTIDPATHKAVLEFELVKGNRYAFAFWAQAAGNEYYNTDDLRSIKMNMDKVKANEPMMDAFWAIDTQSATSTPSSKNITLYRALAQVNFGTVLPASGRADEVSVTESLIKMTGVPDTFHPFKGDNAWEGSVDVAFAKNAAITDEKLKVNGTDYDYLATAYVFAPRNNKIVSDVTATFTLKKSNGLPTTTSVSAPNAPLQGNYRTNVIGDLLTVGAKWNVTINPIFQGVDVNYDEICALLEKGGTATLSKDCLVPVGSFGATISKSVVSKLNLNGNKFSNENGNTNDKAALQVRGELTINGDGEVYCEGGPGSNNAILVEDGGHLIINGGTFNVAKDNNGKSNSTIYARKECQIDIYGGTFMAEEGTNGTPYVLNQEDGITIQCFNVYGGTFIGFNPANVNEAHGTITSFVAPGYKSVKISDTPETWRVQDAAAVVVSTSEEFNSAVTTPNAQVILPAGTFAAPSTIADGVTIEGVAGTIIDIPDQKNYSGKNVTFKSLTAKSPNANYTGLIHAVSVKYVDCTIEGMPFSYATTAVYENCKFVQTSNEAYNIWTYGTTNMTFNDCVFNCAGKSVLIYNEGSVASSIVTFNNCMFNASEKVTGKAAIEVDQTFTAYEVYINNCKTSGFDKGSKSKNVLWNNKKGVAADGNNLKSLKVVVDGVEQTLK